MPKNYVKKYKKKYNSKTFTKRVKEIVHQNAERKRHSFTWSVIPISTTPQEHLFWQNVITGTGPSQRIGHEVRQSYMSFEGYIQAADATNVVRVVVYRRKNANSILTGFTINSAIDDDSFTILKDDLVLMVQGSNSELQKRRYGFNLRNKKCRYDQTTGVTNTNDEIAVALVSDSAVAGHPVMHGHWLIHYYDI